MKPHLIIALTLAFTCCAYAHAGEIVLRESATPVGSIVRLGDVADVEGFDNGRTWSLKLVELVPAPPVDVTRFLTIAEVRGLLFRSGVDLSGASVGGADRVAVAWDKVAQPSETHESNTVVQAPRSGFRNTPTTIATRREVVFLTAVQIEAIADHLREVITQHVEDQAGKPGLLEVSLDLASRDAERLIDSTGELTISGGRAPWTGNQTIYVESDTKTGDIKLALRVSVRDMTPVAVLTRPVARGELLTASHITFEPAPENARLPLNSVPISDINQVVAHEAARNLRPGQVLTTDLCLAPTMVERGQLVSVTAAGGGIRITRQAIARADGRQGEVIEVETTDNQDRLFARVVGSGKLAIVTAVAPPDPPRTFERTVNEPLPAVR